MEAFESFVAVALEVDDFVVSQAVKFPVRMQTRRAAYTEVQTHGYEVDLVAAKADQLVLATVKSFFGSRGVAAEHVTGETTTGEPVSERKRKRYALLNDRVIRRKVVAAAARRYGYTRGQVELRLYVGRFAGRQTGEHEARIRQWASRPAHRIRSDPGLRGYRGRAGGASGGRAKAVPRQSGPSDHQGSPRGRLRDSSPWYRPRPSGLRSAAASPRCSVRSSRTAASRDL